MLTLSMPPHGVKEGLAWRRPLQSCGKRLSFVKTVHYTRLLSPATSIHSPSAHSTYWLQETAGWGGRWVAGPWRGCARWLSTSGENEKKVRSCHSRVVASNIHPVLGSPSARHCTGRKNLVYIRVVLTECNYA